MKEMVLTESDLLRTVKEGAQPLKQMLLDFGVPQDSLPLRSDRTVLVHVIAHAALLANRGQLPDGVTEMLCEDFGCLINTPELIKTVTESFALQTQLESRPLTEKLQKMIYAQRWDRVLDQAAKMSRADFEALLAFLCSRGDTAVVMSCMRRSRLLSEIYRHQVVPEGILLMLMAVFVDNGAEMLFRMWL